MNTELVVKAIKLIYPEITGGFVYWGQKYDGSPLDHPLDGLVWNNQEFKKPSWEEIEAKISEVEIGG